MVKAILLLYYQTYTLIEIVSFIRRQELLVVVVEFFIQIPQIMQTITVKQIQKVIASTKSHKKHLYNQSKQEI